jgi:hypothetical protein
MRKRWQLVVGFRPENALEVAALGVVAYRPAECTEPTEARPGSLGKIEILRERFAAGVELFHPGDEQVLRPL